MGLRPSCVTSKDAESTSPSSFFEDVGLYSIAKFLPSVAGVLLLVILTRVFDPVAYGRYALTMTFVSIGSILFGGWLQQSIIRYASETDDDLFRDTVISSLFGVLLVGGAVGVSGYLLFGDFLGRFEPFYVAGVLLFLAQTTYSTLQAVFQSALNSRAVVGYTAIQTVLKVILAIGIATVLLNSIVGWVWGGVISIGGVSVAMLAKLARGYSPRADRELLRRMARYGIPLVGTTVGYLGLMFADRVLIELLVGTAEVGVYASNYTVVNQGLALVFAPVLQASKPLIMNRWSGDNTKEVQRMLTDYTRYLLLVGIPAVASAIVFAPQLNSLFLGAEYHEGFVVIPIVALGMLAWNLAVFGQQSLEVRERTRLILFGNVIALTVNLGLNILLIPRYGYVGAAVATLVSFLGYGVYIYATTRHYLPWMLPWRTIRNCAVATVMISPVFLLTWGSGIEIILFPVAALVTVAAFIIALYVLGEFSTSEVQFIRRVVSKKIDRLSDDSS